jgi:predicted nuclease of predicted toxin-antitoxin system
MKLLFDEGLSPRLVGLLSDLFPESESALRNGLAGTGDRTILRHALDRNFILVSTDSDFESLAVSEPEARIVILRSCNYPTATAAGILRRNAIRIAELARSHRQVLVLDR